MEVTPRSQLTLGGGGVPKMTGNGWTLTSEPNHLKVISPEASGVHPHPSGAP